MENSERLGRQARPEFELGTSRLPVLRATAVPLDGLAALDVLVMSTKDFPSLAVLELIKFGIGTGFLMFWGFLEQRRQLET